MDRKVLGAVVTALVLALASCGGSATLSRADYLKQANAICRRRAALIATAQRRNREFRAVAKAALPGFKKSIDELASLKGPSELRSKMAELTAIEHAQIARIEAFLSGHRLPRESEAANDKQARLKQELHLDACR